MRKVKKSEKAAQAIAEATGKGIDAARDLGKFFHKVLGQGLEHFGGAFNDWAAVYRYQNALKLADKVEAIHRSRRVEGKTVPIATRLAIPLIQHATLEDDETLQNMWAALIANVTDPSTSIEGRRSLVILLASLEPLDAKVLLAIRQDELSNPGRNSRAVRSSKARKRNSAWVAATLAVKRTHILHSLEALARLGLVEDYLPNKINPNGPVMIPVPVTHVDANIVLSYTGRSLLSACIA